MKKILAQSGKAVCYCLLFVGMQVLVTMAFELVYGVMAGFQLVMSGEAYDVQAVMQGAVEFIYGNSMWIIAISSGLTLLFLWLFFIIRKKKLLREAGLTSFSMKKLPALILLGIGLQLLVSFGMALLPQEMLADYSESVSQVLGTVGIVTIFAQVIAAPLTEEIIFRGLIFSRLKKAMPLWVAAAVSAALFGLMHGQILWTAYAFLLGLLFAAIVIKTGSVTAAVVLHMTFNAGGVLLSLLTVEMPLIVGGLIAAAGLAVSCFAFWLLLRNQKEADIQYEY